MDTRHTKSPAGRAQLRTGPVGRVARALGAVVMGALAYDWVEAGTDWFSRSSTPANMGVWAVIILGAYYGLYQLPEFGFGHPWGKRIAAGFAGILGAAAVATIVIEGKLWAAPLTWLLYSLGASFLIAVAASFTVAIILGTPGCEVGSLAELVRRIRFRGRGDARPDAHGPMWCVAGLHHLDRWEAGRRHRASEGAGS